MTIPLGQRSCSGHIPHSLLTALAAAQISIYRSSSSNRDAAAAAAAASAGSLAFCSGNRSCHLNFKLIIRAVLLPEYVKHCRIVVVSCQSVSSVLRFWLL